MKNTKNFLNCKIIKNTNEFVLLMLPSLCQDFVYYRNQSLFFLTLIYAGFIQIFLLPDFVISNSSL